MPIVLFFVACAFLGYRAGRSHREQPSEVGASRPALPAPERTPLELLRLVELSGRHPQEWLVSEAIRQAYEGGNWRLASSLADRYHLDIETVSSDEVGAEESKHEGAPEEKKPEAPLQAIPEEFTSPIEGLSDEDWTSFVKAMGSDPIEARTDKHVGMFRQRIDRVKSLGLDPDQLTDFASQYEAFCRECADHLQRHDRVFTSTVAMPVRVGGQVHPITASGLLGLFRAAGPRNAMEWVHHHQQGGEVGEQFPRTTQLFLSCNGLF